jgi:two-component system nitrate/nitrite response regulator NarL
MRKKTRITLADDHILFTEGLIAMFANDPDVEILHVHKDGKSLLDGMHFEKTDILLLDIRMGIPDGITVMKEVVKSGYPIRVIMLSTFSDTATMIECKQLGAMGYLLKNATHTELKDAIERVMRGETAFDLLESLHASNEQKSAYLRDTYHITKREWEILMLIKKRHTNRMIGEELHLSLYTVETHRKNLMQKLNLRTPIELLDFIRLHDL